MLRMYLSALSKLPKSLQLCAANSSSMVGVAKSLVFWVANTLWFIARCTKVFEDGRIDCSILRRQPDIVFELKCMRYDFVRGWLDGTAFERSSNGRLEPRTILERWVDERRNEGRFGRVGNEMTALHVVAGKMSRVPAKVQRASLSHRH